ncbi:hypothetical protein Tco_1239046 [Tanacetum coccineum]
MTHPHPKGNLVPKAVLMKSGFKTLNTARQNSSKAAVSVNTARPINTAYLRPTVNSAKTASNIFNRAHSHVRRPFNKYTTNKNINLNKKVNIVRRNVTTVGPKVIVSDNKGNTANALKASACWVWRPKQKVLDHGNPQLEFQDVCNEMEKLHNNKQKWVKGQEIPLNPNTHPQLLHYPILNQSLFYHYLNPKRLKNLGKPKRATEISQSSGPIPLVADETVIKEWEDRMERAATTASSLEAEHDSGNINRTQSMATLNESFPQGTDSGSGPRCQDTILGV